MKKQLLKGLAIVASMCALSAEAQVRYIEPMFGGVNKTSNVMYDSNAAVNILYGQVPGFQPLFSNKLMCDVYEPIGDMSTKRPLVILAHTGSYLPAIVNKQTTGNKNDSSIVEIAKQLAVRGYVVAAIDYRTGWNPTTTNQEVATEQLLKATYRGMQDVRNAVRYFRNNAAMYKIDTSKIIMGGQGTGGYIAYAIATVSTRGDIENNLKFVRGGDLSPMVNMDTLGDWTGVGGWAMMNYSADASVSSDIDMVFNFGGAMGDTAWMKPNSLPIVSMQCTKDPFAPYGTGNVIVPTTNTTVIPNASGASHVIPKANKLGVNNKLNSVRYKDAISQRAMMVPNAENNMFGFESSFPFENAPWEWWNRTILQNTPGVPYARQILCLC
jgi:poly(3-hydroxybutyrate) depolymerase